MSLESPQKGERFQYRYTPTKLSYLECAKVVRFPKALRHPERDGAVPWQDDAILYHFNIIPNPRSENNLPGDPVVIVLGGTFWKTCLTQGLLIHLRRPKKCR